MSPKIKAEGPEESAEDAALRAESAGQDAFTTEQAEEFGSKAEEFDTPRRRQNVTEADSEPREVPKTPPGPADQSSQGGTLGGGAVTGAPGTETSTG